jgi:type IV pilus assembly protein PilY1
VAAPNESYPDLSYAAFAVAQASRPPMLYVGANDGMLHGLNATTGKEVMAFIPNGGSGGVFNNLYMLAAPFYFFHHQFYVDGSPQVTDALLSDGQWHSLLVGGENAGGSTIYAIDVTNPGNFISGTTVASAVKWEFTDPGMGLSYSTPAIVRSNAVTVTDASNHLATNGFAVLFGNGYNSPSGQPIFYAVDASTGAILTKINLCTATGVPTTACSSSAANGLSSISAANSSGVIGVPQDMAYAGDLQGNLWSINMSSATPANWTVKLLFQAKDTLGNAQPITSAPALTPNPNFPTNFGLMAFFGTGQLLQQADLTNTNTQSFYGIWDNTSDLANYHSPVATPAPPYTRSNLQSQTITPITVSISGLSVQALETTYNPVEGWYFDLASIASGTRAYTNAQVESGGVVFTTATPPANACDQPESYLMNVNFSTGGPFALASIGAVGGGTTIAAATSAGTAVIITGVFASASYTSAPTSVIAPNGSNVQIVNCGGKLCEAPTAGNKPNRVGWWQIQ